MMFPAFKSDPIYHPWDDAPPPGQMTEVAPGVHWIRMPLPISLQHINLWLLEDAEGWVLVDTGFGTAETQTLWQQVLDGPAAHLKPSKLICTHHHPDHFGQAGWLTKTYDIPCLMPEKEWIVGTLLGMLTDQAFASGQERFYIDHGVPGDVRGRLHAVGNAYRNLIGNPLDAFTRIRDGQDLVIGGRTWQVLELEGHSESLGGLYCPDLRVFIAGDQILPKITPNISVHWFKDGTEPLSDYLDSLDRLANILPDDTLVLPSHKLPFTGALTRIAQLQQHHRDRLDALLAAMVPGEARDAWSFLPVLFPRALEDDHIMFALGESVAHLEHFVTLGAIAKSHGPEGIRYTRVG